MPLMLRSYLKILRLCKHFIIFEGRTTQTMIIVCFICFVELTSTVFLFLSIRFVNKTNSFSIYTYKYITFIHFNYEC